VTKAAIYTRVSSEAQASEDRASLTDQRERSEAYCQMEGWEIVGVYEDAGVSGAKASRPSLDRLLKDAADGKFERVVFLKLDRLGRSLRDLLNLSKTLEDLGVGIVSVHDKFDTATLSGRLYFSLLGAFAEFERGTIIARTIAGKWGGARKGRWQAGWMAYGYDRDPEGHMPVINEVEAAVVRRIFDLYVNGSSATKIANLLRAEGVPTKGRGARSIDGEHKGWHRTSITRLLTNPMYMGEAYYGKTQKDRNGRAVPRPREEWESLECPAIITREVWDAARKRSDRNVAESRMPSAKKTAFLLSSLIFCKECGRKMYSQSRRTRRNPSYQYRNYVCPTAHNYGQCRTPVGVSAERVEAAVLTELVRLYSEPERVLEACEAQIEMLERGEGEIATSIAAHKNYIAAAEKKRDRLVEIYTEGMVKKATFSKQLKAIERDLNAWGSELSRLEEEAKVKTDADALRAQAAAIAEQAGEVFAHFTEDEKRRFSRLLIERVTIDGQNNLEVRWRVPRSDVTDGDTVDTLGTMNKGPG
jgi:site-specific DNA recombinase